MIPASFFSCNNNLCRFYKVWPKHSSHTISFSSSASFSPRLEYRLRELTTSGRNILMAFCNPGCKMFHIFFHSQYACLILLIRKPWLQFCIHRITSPSPEFPEQRVRTFLHLFSCHADQTGSRGIRLQTALSSTGTAHAAYLDNGMAELRSS